jgi:hypothetical protein
MRPASIVDHEQRNLYNVYGLASERDMACIQTNKDESSRSTSPLANMCEFFILESDLS